MMKGDVLRDPPEEAERQHEEKLRPKDFSEYIGQNQIVENIVVMAESACIRRQAMDHVLLSGPPGLGKTSLAMILAPFLGSELHLISGPAIDKKGDLAAILSRLSPRDILFIDEIHRMPISTEEILYSAMEDYRLDIILGQGATARTLQLALEPFTLIGATTRSGLLSAPLRDRFIAHLHFDFYDVESLGAIVRNNAKKLSMDITDAARLQVARSARGTPRIANRILRRVRDYTLIKRVEKITEREVNYALNLMEIDSFSLDRLDRKILRVIQEYYDGGPVGIEALCATLGEDRGTIEDVHEPYLLKKGFLLRTARGRMLTEKGKGVPLPSQ